MNGSVCIFIHDPRDQFTKTIDAPVNEVHLLHHGSHEKSPHVAEAATA